MDEEVVGEVVEDVVGEEDSGKDNDVGDGEDIVGVGGVGAPVEDPKM